MTNLDSILKRRDITPEVGDGQGGLACWSTWGHKESDTTEQLNWTEHRGLLANTAMSGQPRSALVLREDLGGGFQLHPRWVAMWGRWSACVEASGFLGCQGCKINTQVQRLFLKRPPAAPTRQRHVPGHTPCSRWVHRPGPQGCRTACFQPPAGVGGQPQGDQGPRSPRTRASGLLPARGLEGSAPSPTSAGGPLPEKVSKPSSYGWMGQTLNTEKKKIFLN